MSKTDIRIETARLVVMPGELIVVGDEIHEWRKLKRQAGDDHWNKMHGGSIVVQEIETPFPDGLVMAGYRSLEHKNSNGRVQLSGYEFRICERSADSQASCRLMGQLYRVLGKDLRVGDRVLRWRDSSDCWNAQHRYPTLVQRSESGESWTTDLSMIMTPLEMLFEVERPIVRCRFPGCDKSHHGLYGLDRVPKCLEHSKSDISPTTIKALTTPVAQETVKRLVEKSRDKMREAQTRLVRSVAQEMLRAIRVMSETIVTTTHGPSALAINSAKTMAADMQLADTIKPNDPPSRIVYTDQRRDAWATVLRHRVEQSETEDRRREDTMVGWDPYGDD